MQSMPWLGCAALVLLLLNGGCSRSRQDGSAARDGAHGVRPQDLEDLRSPGDRVYAMKLAGFGERGEKDWELFGNRAQIIEELIYLTDVVSIAYGEEETVRVRSDRGTFNRSSSVAVLEEHVVSTVQSNQPPASNAKAAGQTVITCTGPLDVDLEKKVAVFHENVIVTDPEAKIFSEILEVYFNEPDAPVESGVALAEPEMPAAPSSVAAPEAPRGVGGRRRLTKMIAKVNVKIVQEGKTTYCDQATYTLHDRKVKIEGNPRVELMESGLTSP